jgi:hypothetical protein
MRLKNILLMAALGLTMSALTAQAAPKIPISAVPFNITGPGTYELVGNLTCTTPIAAAITISNITGPVILDFKGFTITGFAIGGSGTGVVINGGPNNPPTTGNPNSVTIRNGTVSMFQLGVLAESLNDLTISKMHFRGVPPGDLHGGTGIQLNFVNDSLISDCTIASAGYGIVDNQSFGGNRYENVFCGAVIQLEVSNDSIGKTITHCEFAEPVN